MAVKQGIPTPGATSPVNAGMSEQEAGEALADYIGRASEALGVENGQLDVDLFDGSVLEAAREVSPPSSGSGDPPARPAEPSSPEADGGPAGATDANEEDEGETPPATSDEEEQDETGADAEVESIEVAVLAELLGVEEDALVVTEEGQPTFRYQVGEERGTATLGDLVKSYQLQGHVNQKSEQLSEERRQLREQVARHEQELAQAIQAAGAFKEAMQRRVLERYQQVDWDKLRTENPSEWSAVQLELNQELSVIEQESEAVAQAAQQQLMGMQARRMEEVNLWREEQRRQLNHHIPELADESTRLPTLQKYQDYLVSYGFTPQEIQGMEDHRFFRVIHDAVAYQAVAANGGQTPVSEEQKQLIKKQLVKVPRVMKPGAAESGETAGKDRVVRAARRLKQTGSDEDAARFAVESGVVDSML